MDARARFLVHCSCGGEGDDEVALIDDYRQSGAAGPALVVGSSVIDHVSDVAGGCIYVHAPESVDGEVRQQLALVDPPIRFENRPDLNEALKQLIPHAIVNAHLGQSSRNVTQTVWEDGHSSWAIRCMRCDQQVQLSTEVVVAVVDALSDALDKLDTRLVIEPGWATGQFERHLIPLGVLHLIVLQLGV